MKSAILTAAILAALAGLTSTATAQSSQSSQDTKASSGADHPFTWNDLTLYGVVDIGIANQSHGTPISDYYAQGLEYGITSNSNHSVTALAPNGLSQSRIGLKGIHAFTDECSGVFTVETRFSPLSGEIANGPRSLIQNNGVALANQVSASDSSQAGQLFSAAAFGGVTSKTYGTFTIGRQNGLLYDNVLKYDPNGGSYAFSLIGFSAITAGAGDSEYNRLNGSARYTNQFGPVRAGLQYQPAGQEVGGAARQVNLGADIEHLSVDLTYVNKRNAIALASFAQPITTGQLATLSAANLSPTNSLKATISDNSSWTLAAKYDLRALHAYAGYERIAYGNPNAGGNFVQIGSSTVGGYFIGALTTNAYVKTKVLQVEWAGLKYDFSPKIRLTGALYRYGQNSYATGSAAGCSSTVSTACSGGEIAYSLLGEYQYNRYFDFYAGALRSAVSGGLASGFLNNSTVSTMAGVRLSF